MTSVEKKISFLISRLSWPSVFIREKTCSSITYLLLHPYYSETVKKKLLSWLSKQKLETMVIVGVLVFAKAKLIDRYFYINIKEINHAIKKPSIMSWILLNYINNNYSFPDLRKFTSGIPPHNFEVNPIFKKYKKSFTPPIYSDYSESIENRTFFPFTEQWAYEWKNILEEMDFSPLEFKNRAYNIPPSHREYLLAGCHYELSEIYRSAFLRSVAFGVLTGVLNKNEAIFLSTLTCPVDLGIWKSKTYNKPDFWPKIYDKTDIKKTIWEKISLLKNQIETKSGWIISEASGRLYEKNSIYDLNIMGIFEIPDDGQSKPDFEKVSKEYKVNIIDYEQKYEEYPILEGQVKFQSPMVINEYTNHILPVSGFVKPPSIPIWQYFKTRRNIWIPMPFILSNNLKFNFENDKTTILGSDVDLQFNFSQKGLMIDDGNNIFAKWMYWADSLAEKTNLFLPPSNGQYLVIKKETINNFLLETGSRFSWLCELTEYKEKGIVDVTYEKINEYQKLNFSFNP
jgi:hypothetical protein